MVLCKIVVIFVPSIYKIVTMLPSKMVRITVVIFKSFFFSVAVQALEVMYNVLNSPTQLTGWKIGGGDPCGESWKGVTCEGSAVVSM